MSVQKISPQNQKPSQTEPQQQTHPVAARVGRLGRGLAALIGDISTDIPGRPSMRRLPLASLKANPNNPRKSFTEDNITDLAHSIRQKGLLQPIIVRQVSKNPDEFEIVAGERRWRAAKQIGMVEVPVIVHTLDDKQALELALVENIQRADLDPLEEAMGYQRLLSEFSYTQELLSTVIGKSRSHISNIIRLLKLPESVQEHVRSGKLTPGHARAIIKNEDPETAARYLMEQGMTVRQAEALQRKKSQEKGEKPNHPGLNHPEIKVLEKTLGDILGMKISIQPQGQEAGTLHISYKTQQQLDFLCHRLNPLF